VPAMGAWMIGRSIPSRSSSGLRAIFAIFRLLASDGDQPALAASFLR
jgi:hypothetical protein